MPDAVVDWKQLHGNAFRGRRCLVTGGNGFIGGHLTEALAALEADIVILDNGVGGNAEPYVDAELHDGDVRHLDACLAAAEGCDVAFHLAAKVSVPASVEDPVSYHATDATGTVNLLEASRQAGVRRMVYSASSSAYGDQPTLPKVESMAELPMSPYAAAKLAGEGYCRAYASCYDLDAVSLRYFNIFGPRQNANSAYAGVIAAFARDLLNGERPTIFGDGSASRDFTHVYNAVHANLLAARHDQRLGGEVFNVGVGLRETVADLARHMAEAVGRADLTPVLKPPRPGDVPHSLASLEKSTRVLGYRPIMPFSDGIAATVEWYAAERQPA